MTDNNPRDILDTILRRTGRYFLVTMIGLTLLVVTPIGIVLAFFTIQMNTGWTQELVSDILIASAAMMLVRNIFLLVSIHSMNRACTNRIGALVKPQPGLAESTDQVQPWRQVVHITRQYLFFSFGSLIFLFLIPMLVFMKLALGIANDQLLYTILGAVGVGLVLEVFEALLIDRLLLPARLLLLPDQFDDQLAGMGGFRIQNKIQLTMFSIILISIFIFTPLAISQSVSNEASPFSGRLLEITFGSLVVLFLGFFLSSLLAHSLVDPVRIVVDGFKKVEAGSIGEKVLISSTDEIGELGIQFNRLAKRYEDFQNNLESMITKRTDQLKAINDVGRATSSLQNTEQLIDQVVNLITDRFGFYYSAVFLVDDNNRWAELAGASGVAGQMLKAQGHKLQIGRRSMVSNTILSRQPSIALDVGDQPVRFDNPLLPDTRSEIALPMIVGDSVIGVLDVQSTVEAAFSEENIETFQGMANQLGIAIQNARLFQQTQRNLDELRASQKVYLANSWSHTARENKEVEIAVGGSDDENQEGSITEIPLTLRDHQIGQLHLEGQAAWSAEEQAMIEAIATQATLAMENARLLEESQQIAMRERLVAEITGKIWAGSDTDIILQTAIRELGRALSADEGTIELKIDDGTSGTGNA
jgi:GAF domain-containing protein